MTFYAKFKHKNKFNNKRSKCFQGHYHPSKLEADYCNLFQHDKEMGKIADYRTQIKYDFKINGVHICYHITDFEVIELDGSITIYEVKGYETGIWKLKAKLFKALYPEIPYKVVK